MITQAYEKEIDHINQQIELTKRLDSVNSHLQKYNWIFLHPYSQGMDIGILQRIVSEDPNPQEQILNFFAHKFFDLRTTTHFIEGFYKTRPFLQDYVSTIRESVVLCLQKDYRGAITVLIPVIEGTLRKFLIQNEGPHKKGVIRISELLKAFAAMTVQYVALQKDYLRKRHAHLLAQNDYFSPVQEDQILEQYKIYFTLWIDQVGNYIKNNLYLSTKTNHISDNLNRHLIFHALQDNIDFSFSNYLRLFNCINFLSWSIGLLYDECSVLSEADEEEVKSIYNNYLKILMASEALTETKASIYGKPIESFKKFLRPQYLKALKMPESQMKITLRLMTFQKTSARVAKSKGRETFFLRFLCKIIKLLSKQTKKEHTIKQETPMGFNFEKIINECLTNIRKDFQGTEEEFVKKVQSPEATTGLIEVIKNGLRSAYKKSILNNIHEQEVAINKALYEMNKEALDDLQMFIDINKYIGNEMTKILKAKAKSDEDLRHHLLLDLHARGCQVLTEIQTLIRFGYADGAQARWRTLHEVCVTFLVLLENKPELSRMYFDFQAIEKLHRAEDFGVHHKTLNWKPIDPKAIVELENEKQRLISAYGKDFAKNYGWTKSIISDPKKRHFKTLEQLAGLDHLRPFYTWACNNVHSGAEGLTNKMAFSDVSQLPYLTLTSPSRYGLADPVQFSTYSMVAMSSGLISMNPTFDNTIVQTVVEDLHQRIAGNLFKVQVKLREEIEEIERS